MQGPEEQGKAGRARCFGTSHRRAVIGQAVKARAIHTRTQRNPQGGPQAATFRPRWEGGLLSRVRLPLPFLVMARG